MKAARRTIHILNWSFAPWTRLTPEDSACGQIGDFLKARAEEGVDVRILCWKSALPVAATQKFFPLQDRRCFANSKVRFKLDGRLPFGACHHQKMIVIDDQLAFAGGADIGPDRWDTPAHADMDPGRGRTRPGRFYAARHEVMALVDAAAAEALGGLFRERWRRATGEVLPRPLTGPPASWPREEPPQFENLAVGLSRTSPRWRAWPEIRECQALTLASIAAARRCIYMENQYYTSPVAAAALAARLTEADGPEVVLIAAEHSPSWFDRMTMDRARWGFLERLRAADRHGRFHIYSPTTTLGAPILVHAKLAIIDDDLVRVGSANLNNRSGGFDTECDLSLRAGDDQQRAAAAALRTRLVAHWLGCGEADVAEAQTRAGSLGGAMEALRAGGRCRLRPITPAPHGVVAGVVAAYHIGDPDGAEDSFRLGLRRKRLAASVAAVEA
jgi:phosphatidylserine/phosphatidylglycerophosphate/cardiolipin synthase-like enzyme